MWAIYAYEPQSNVIGAERELNEMNVIPELLKV